MNRKDFKLDKWLSSPQQNSDSVQPQCVAAQNTAIEPNRFSPDNQSDIETITQRIEQAAIDIAPNYADWRDLGFALADALGENGRSYYHRISRFYEGYSAAETDKQFTACLNAHGHGVTAKTFFQLAKNAGVDIRGGRSYNFVKQKSSNPQREEMRISMQNAQSVETTPEPLPSFSQNVKERLPSLLKQIVQNALSNEDADLLILGSLTVFSACLPNVYGFYGQREVYPNLFLFVTAQASAGKGRLTLCRYLVEPIHKNLRDAYQHSMQDYKLEQAAYVADKKNNEPPQEPPLQTLFIPANSSATSVYQVLNDNNGVGLMFETEGDTLANTFKTDYGNYSDGFRKAFHHETISYNRRKDREFVELPKPKFSVLLSGTPRQVLGLIPDAENGLFSRFIFYSMNTQLVWNDVFARVENDEALDTRFEHIGTQFFDLYKLLKASEPIRFSFSEPQQLEFNAFFEQVQQQYADLFGYDIIASVRRLGLITFRIAMILSAVRILDYGEIASLIVCTDDDFQSALAMVKVLLQHTAFVFESLPEVKASNSTAEVKQQFYELLPPEFDRKTYLSAAQNLNITAKSAERYIRQWCNKAKLLHPSHDRYQKQ
jgi:hypothetical protein